MGFFIGLMSGTSADAVDAALVSFDDQTIKLEYFQEQPFPPEIKKRIAEMRSPEAKFSLKEIAEFNIALGKVFAEATNQLITSAEIDHKKITAIGSHGQTILHAPDGSSPFSMQLGDPNTIATITGITTIADFRSMDIAVGGQGAPLVPGFHEVLFRDQNKTRIILNLGGIANITLLPASPDQFIVGFDTGPANALMDDWILLKLGESYDKNGLWGKSGEVIPALLKEMLNDDYFQKSPPKSTGREYFNLEWLYKKKGSNIDTYRPEDVQATLQHFTVQSIAGSIENIGSEINEVILCGGGTHNDHIVNLLSETLPEITTKTTADYGFDPDCIEAMAFAWLAKRRLDNLPGNLPSVTGAKKEVLLGGVYG